MTVLALRVWPDPVLSMRAVPVGDGAVADLARDLLDTMYAASGRGLAAPQVGVLRRVFVMDAGWKSGAATPQVFIDPRVIETAGPPSVMAEGCLSIPGVLADVARPSRVRLDWRDADGAARDAWFDGFEATCVQHEIDHLDGILTFDRISPDAARRLQESMIR